MTIGIYLSERPPTRALLARRVRSKRWPCEAVDSPLLPDAIATFKKLFHEIDDKLGDGDWLVGEMFSLADISMVVYVNRLASFQMAPLWNDMTRLKAWNERIRARPTYHTAVTEWGDTTSQKRIELGDQAFPKVKALWDAA